MDAIAVIQARMGSTRLPGKVLLELCGDPILYHIVKRVKHAQRISKIVVATSVNAEDDAIYSYCQSIGINCFRGSESNVLSRYFHAAEAFHIKQGDSIVRVTADNPLVDPKILDSLLAYFERQNLPYAATSGFPLGVGAEAFTFTALEEAFEKATKPHEKEHVTPYMYREGCTIGRLMSPADCSRLRFTLDTPEDYEFIKEVYSALYHGAHNFYLDDVLKLLAENPYVAEINSHVRQKGVME